jgi:tRNA-Thr(GGU) m(6)t(6)A37 methyltransferase TsaA
VPPRLQLQPIGVVRSPFREKRSAPRQPAAARGVTATIELDAGLPCEHMLQDLAGFSHLWVLFWFHRSAGYKAKVKPPRSRRSRGVLATRAPHRPNPIGLSLVRLLRIEGRALHVSDVDMLDGTPVLDLKPYLAYADSAERATSGWLESDAAVRDPGPRYSVHFSERAEEQLAWLSERTALDLRGLSHEALALGPAPHPYRRIKDLGDCLRIGIKDFRLKFVVQGTDVTVLELATGYRPSVLADPSAVAREQTPLDVHREFVARFGERARR